MGIFSKKVKKSAVLGAIAPDVINNAPVVLYNYGARDFLEFGYAINADIYAIVKKITDKANVATPYVYVDNSAVKMHKGELRSKYDVAKHRLSVSKSLTYADANKDITKLIANPNDTQTWREFITLFRIIYHVQGEAFIYRESGDDNCALSLHIAPSHLMTPIVDDGKLVGWSLDLLNGYRRNFYKDTADDLLHFKMPNPLYNNNSQFRGFSPLNAGLKYLNLNDSGIVSWIKSVQNEGAKGVISPNHPNPDLWLTPEQVQATQAKVEEKMHGSDNRNKIVVSGMPLQYASIGLSPDALNIVSGLEHSSSKLCALWGVPSILFERNPTYENQKAANDRFVRDVILPYLSSEEDKLNSWLVAPFSKRDGKRYVIDYDLSAYEELRIDAADVDILLKTHTINEVRVMQGSDEIEEEYANQVFISQGMMPLSDYSVNIDI